MSEPEFETFPTWGATVYHSERGATNPWTRVFDSPVTGDDVADRRTAMRKMVAYFQDDGLNPITIYTIELAPLKSFTEGGEDGSN